jgi:hypothetical protein
MACWSLGIIVSPISVASFFFFLPSLLTPFVLRAAGKHELDEQPNDLSRLAANIVTAFAPNAQAKGVAMELRADVQGTSLLMFDRVGVHKVCRCSLSSPASFSFERMSCPCHMCYAGDEKETWQLAGIHTAIAKQPTCSHGRGIVVIWARSSQPAAVKNGLQ